MILLVWKSMGADDVIVLERVSKSYDGGKTVVLDNLSLTVGDGEILVLLGSSGSGKTTVLKMMNRLITPTTGRIELDGQNILAFDAVTLRRSIGYVFQGLGLFPHMTVGQNVAVVPKLLGWPKERRETRVKELLSLVGLPAETYANRFPDELSGGQQQRVAVARALASDPTYLLMDEPFGALDPLTRESMQQEILKLNRELGKTIVFVTHDIFEALTLGDRIALLHQGVLQQVGTKEAVLQQPATPFVHDTFAKYARQLSRFGGMMG